MIKPEFNPQYLGDWVRAAIAAPEEPWLIENFIPAGGLTIISGRPKLSKKSWLSFLSAMVISSGKEAGGLVPTGKFPVLYLCLEGSIKPTAERFPMLSKGHGIDIDDCQFHMMLGTPFLLDSAEHVRVLCEFVVEHRIKCVFVDTFSRSFLGDENSAKDVGAAMRGVEQVLSLGCSVVLVHHVKKEQAGASNPMYDPDSGLRGSSALAGAFDSLIAIKTIPNEDENGFDVWAISGGKIKEYQAFEVNWTISKDSARLNMDGPQDLPEPKPQQKVRF